MKRIQIASVPRRLLSALIDIAILSGLTCLFYFCVFNKVVSDVQHFPEVKENIKREQLASGLYVEKDGQTISIILNDPSYQTTEDRTKLKGLEDIIHNFYTDYLRNKLTVKDDITYTEYWYGVHILHLSDELKLYQKENLPSYEVVYYRWITIDKDNATYTLKDDISTEAYRSFLISTFGTATYDLAHTPFMNDYNNTIAWGTIRAVVYSSIIGTIIPCLIVPVIAPNGKTIGKLCTKLIVLTDEGYYYKRYKHIFRYLAFYIIEFFGGIMTVGLTLLFSTCMALFSKKHRALHDYIAFSVVVDEVHTVFFKDEQEELEFKKQQELLTNKKTVSQ